jgi:hypothetical protein
VAAVAFVCDVIILLKLKIVTLNVIQDIVCHDWHDIAQISHFINDNLPVTSIKPHVIREQLIAIFLNINNNGFLLFIYLLKGSTADATALRLIVHPVMNMIKICLLFQFNETPVEWNWQGKTEVLGEEPIPVPLCPPQIPNGHTRDRNRASTLRSRRLTASAVARR